MMAKKNSILSLIGFVTVSQVCACDLLCFKNRRANRQSDSCASACPGDCGKSLNFGCSPAPVCCQSPHVPIVSECANFGGSVSATPVTNIEPLPVEEKHSEMSGAQVQNSVAKPKASDTKPQASVNELQEKAPDRTGQNSARPDNLPDKTPEPVSDEQRKAAEELRRSKDGVKFILPQMRSWEDSSGKYRAVAKLQEIKGNHVLLLKDDGKTVQVELTRLSQPDQVYVQSYRGSESSLLVSEVSKGD